MSQDILIGVDICTGSARSGFDDCIGRLLARTPRPSVRQARTKAGVGPDRIAGIGFDAACSLVVMGASRLGTYRILPAATAGITGGADPDPSAGSRIAATHQRRFDAFQTLQRVAHPLAGIGTRET